MTEPVLTLDYLDYNGQIAEPVQRPVIAETPWVLYLDRRELVTFMCTPTHLHCLALGFLLSEGMIASIDEIWQLRVYRAEDRVYIYFPEAGLDQERHQRTCDESIGSIDVRLRRPAPARRDKRIITTGCGGGITFDDLSGQRPALQSQIRISAAHICELMQHMHTNANLYRQSRGVHTSALYDPGSHQQLVMAEDVGRHNTLDKIRGACAFAAIPTRDRILMTSGRISTEMIGKARSMEIPL